MSNIEIINMSTDELIQDSLKIFKEKGDKEECFKRIESLNKDIKIKIQTKKEIVELNSILEKDISQFQNAINFFSTKPKVKFSKFKTDNERIEEEKIRINEIQIIEAEAERLRLIEAEQAEAERLRFESEKAEAQKAETERLRFEAEQAEAERLRFEAEQAEAERLRFEAEQAEAERLRLEAEQAEAERLRFEAEKAEAQKAETERLRLIEVQKAEDEEKRREQLRVQTEQEELRKEQIRRQEQLFEEDEQKRILPVTFGDTLKNPNFCAITDKQIEKFISQDSILPGLVLPKSSGKNNCERLTGLKLFPDFVTRVTRRLGGGVEGTTFATRGENNEQTAIKIAIKYSRNRDDLEKNKNEFNEEVSVAKIFHSLGVAGQMDNSERRVLSKKYKNRFVEHQFFSMGRVDGILLDYLDEKSRSEQQIIKIADDIFNIVKILNFNSYTHGDMHIQNVGYIKKEDDNIKIQLIDFGRSRHVSWPELDILQLLRVNMMFTKNNHNKILFDRHIRERASRMGLVNYPPMGPINSIEEKEFDINLNAFTRYLLTITNENRIEKQRNIPKWIKLQNRNTAFNRIPPQNPNPIPIRQNPNPIPIRQNPIRNVRRNNNIPQVQPRRNARQGFVQLPPNNPFL